MELSDSHEVRLRAVRRVLFSVPDVLDVPVDGASHCGGTLVEDVEGRVDGHYDLRNHAVPVELGRRPNAQDVDEDESGENYKPLGSVRALMKPCVSGRRTLAGSAHEQSLAHLSWKGKTWELRD